MKICGCGHSNPDSFRFCESCGKPIAETQQQTAQQDVNQGYIPNQNNHNRGYAENPHNPYYTHNPNQHNPYQGYAANQFNAGRGGIPNQGYYPNQHNLSQGDNPNSGYNPNQYTPNQGSNPNLAYGNQFNGMQVNVSYVPDSFIREPVHNDKNALLYRSQMAIAIKSPITLIAGILLIISGIVSPLAISLPLSIVLGIGILVLRKASAGNPNSLNKGMTWITVHNILSLGLMVIVTLFCFLCITVLSAIINSPPALKEYTSTDIEFAKQFSGFLWCLITNSISAAVTSVIGLCVMGNLKNAFTYGRRRCRSLNVYAVSCFIAAAISIIVLIVCLIGFNDFYTALVNISGESSQLDTEPMFNLVIFAILPVLLYVASHVILGLSLMKIQNANDSFSLRNATNPDLLDELSDVNNNSQPDKNGCNFTADHNNGFTAGQN